jgi:hypothetical protein
MNVLTISYSNLPDQKGQAKKLIYSPLSTGWGAESSAKALSIEFRAKPAWIVAALEAAFSTTPLTEFFAELMG